MDFDIDKWKEGPTDDVLRDDATEVLKNAECLKRTQALAFQLKLCLDIKSLLDMWDKEALPAWQAVAGHAGGIIQRSLVKELVLLTTHLVDDRKDSSSVASLHKSCVLKKLTPGPFKSFYMPLFAEIVKRGKELKGIRDGIIAHTNWEKLHQQLYGERDANWGDVSISRLFELLSLITWYVQLLHAVLGIGVGKLERRIDGADRLRSAVVYAWQSQANSEYPDGA